MRLPTRQDGVENCDKVYYMYVCSSHPADWFIMLTGTQTTQLFLPLYVAAICQKLLLLFCQLAKKFLLIIFFDN